MAAFFSDTFTETSNTSLASHTPNVGTSWTLVFADGARRYQVEALADQVRADGNGGNQGFIYSADATYPSANYEIQFTLIATVGATVPVYVFARLQDQENMYAVRLLPSTGTCQLYKKVSGTWTALGSLFDAPANGSVCKLMVSGTSISFWDDGVQVASATDSAISAAGKAGIGQGGGAELVLSTDDITATNCLDDFGVTEIVTSVVITCGVGSLALGEHSASIVKGAVTVACTPSALALGESPAVIVKGGVSIACVHSALALGEHVSVIVPGGVSVPCGVSSLALGEHASAIIPGSVTIACSFGSLALGEHVAAIIPGAVTIACVTGELALGEHAATIQNSSGPVVVCGVGDLTLGESPAAIVPGGISIACAVGTLTLNEAAGTVSPGGVNIACSVGELSLGEHASFIVAGGVTISCAVNTISLNEHAAAVLPGSVTVACAVGELALGEQAATLIPGSVDIHVHAAAADARTRLAVVSDAPVRSASLAEVNAYDAEASDF